MYVAEPTCVLDVLDIWLLKYNICVMASRPVFRHTKRSFHKSMQATFNRAMKAPFLLGPSSEEMYLKITVTIFLTMLERRVTNTDRDTRGWTYTQMSHSKKGLFLFATKIIPSACILLAGIKARLMSLYISELAQSHFNPSEFSINVR